MKSRAFLPLFGLVFLISFVSAAFFPYSTSYSLSDFLYTFDASTVTLVSIFLISFILIFIALSRTVLKDYRGPAGVVAFAIAFLIIFEYNRRGYSYGFDSLFYSIGYSGDLSYLIAVIFLGVLVFSVSKLGFARFFLVGGILLFALSLPISNIVYAKVPVFILSLVFLILSFVVSKMTEKKVNPLKALQSWQYYDSDKEEKQFKNKWAWIILGVLLVIFLLLVIFAG